MNVLHDILSASLNFGNFSNKKLGDNVNLPVDYEV